MKESEKLFLKKFKNMKFRRGFTGKWSLGEVSAQRSFHWLWFTWDANGCFLLQFITLFFVGFFFSDTNSKFTVFLLTKSTNVADVISGHKLSQLQELWVVCVLSPKKCSTGFLTRAFAFRKGFVGSEFEMCKHSSTLALTPKSASLLCICQSPLLCFLRKKKEKH